MDSGFGHPWVDGFDRGWCLEDREAWFRHFEAMVAPDVHLVQPVLPDAHGLAEFRQTFEVLFSFVPDLRARVSSWAGKGTELFIAFTMTGTPAGRATLSWRAVDRVLLNDDGLATLRESFFDPTPLMGRGDEPPAE